MRMRFLLSISLMIGLISGCDSSSSAPIGESAATPRPEASPAQSVPAAKATPQPETPAQPEIKPLPLPLPTTSGWEDDVAKHVIGEKSVVGMLGAQKFDPEASLFDQTLSFRILKPGAPSRSIEISLTPEMLSKVSGSRIQVRPEQPDGPTLPRIVVEMPTSATDARPKAIQYPNGYALTLELRKKEKNRYEGRICLAIPDVEKSYLVGSFSVSRVRSLEKTPPGSDDTPFVQGKIEVSGFSDPKVEVGYVGNVMLGSDSLFVQGQLELPFSSSNLSTYYDFGAGRITSLIGPTYDLGHEGRFEHTCLPPSRYLVYARLIKGPAVWKWLTIEAQSQLRFDIAIDGGKVGNLLVTVPAGFEGPVRIAPVDDPAKSLDAGMFFALAVMLGLESKPVSGTASFKDIGAGTYEIRAGEDLKAMVVIKPGMTEKIELKK